MTERSSLEQIVLARLMRLNALVHGLVAGLVVGLGIFLATNWLLLKGGEVAVHISRYWVSSLSAIKLPLLEASLVSLTDLPVVSSSATLSQ